MKHINIVSDYVYTLLSRRIMVPQAGVPRGLVSYPRAYKNQFRCFKSHRVQILVGTFSCIKKLISGERESVS